MKFLRQETGRQGPEARGGQKEALRSGTVLVVGSLAVVMALGIGIWLWWGDGGRYFGLGDRAWEGADVPADVASSPEPARALIATAAGEDGVNYVPDVIELARRLNAPETDGQFDLGILQELFETVSRFSKEGVPEGGNNAEITAQMLGGNRLRLAVLPRDLPWLDAEGRLLDRWGTPYFMHPVSSFSIEVRSAGPDRVLWNADDLVSGEEFVEEPSDSG